MYSVLAVLVYEFVSSSEIKGTKAELKAKHFSSLFSSPYILSTVIHTLVFSLSTRSNTNNDIQYVRNKTERLLQILDVFYVSSIFRKGSEG